MSRINPQMITLARECEGLTQTALAAQLPFTQATLSRYESGTVEPPAEHVAALADALGKPTSYFYRPHKVYGATLYFHRKRNRVPTGTLKQIHALLNEQRIRAAILMNDADLDTDHRFHRISRERFRTPEDAARELRRLWQVSHGPILNLIASVEAAGGIVFRCRFPTRDIDGLSQWPADDPGSPPVFFLNADAPGDRQRFTLAHEIGHTVLHHVPPESDLESEADRFAREFLMPADEIRVDLYDLTLERAAALKSYWKVSMAAIIVCAHRLGCIPQRRYEYLITQMNKLGFRTAEPEPISPEKPTLYEALFELHRNTLDATDADLAAKLAMLPGEFVDEYGRGRGGLRVIHAS